MKGFGLLMGVYVRLYGCILYEIDQRRVWGGEIGLDTTYSLTYTLM